MKNLNKKPVFRQARFGYTAILIVCLLFMACTVDGEPGTDGKDGNANVTTITFNNSTFKDGTNNFSIKAIDKDIVNYGAVLAYMKPSGTTTYYALPFTFGKNEVSIYTVKVGEITLRANYDSKTAVDFKFVIIGGKTANASKNTKNGILSDLEKKGIAINNYDQIAQFYNLKDQ